MLTTDRQARAGLYDKYGKASEFPLLILAVIMIPVILAPLIFPLSSEQEGALETIDWFIYAAFAADFLLKLYLAPSRLKHILENWVDIIVLALPLLRPLRIVRSARLLRLLRLARLLAFTGAALTRLRGILTGRGLHWVMLITIGVVTGSAALVTLFEQGGPGTIQDFPAALWWAATTVTTVGYGDTYPVTAEGRGIAVLLMIMGIAFFGILTANVAAYFVETKEESSNAELERKLDQVLQRLSTIEAAQTAQSRAEQE